MGSIGILEVPSASSGRALRLRAARCAQDDRFWIGCVVIFAALMLSAAVASAQAATSSVKMFPANRAKNVNPDTHLVLTFASEPTIGSHGRILVYDAAGMRLVDTLDMSVPAGPDPAYRVTTPTTFLTAAQAAAALAPLTTTPGVSTTPADLHNYQLDTIGGLEDFHFYPIIVHGNTATITLHHRVLEYGHRYVVKIEPGVLTTAANDFQGVAEKEWSFSTKRAGPAADATRVVVAADGSGDFNTVEGAVDFAPAHPAKRLTIFLRDGTYEEIVFVRGKSNLTFEGEDRDKVQVGYGDNSAFNPPMPGPSRRCAFSVYDSTDVELENFSVSNYDYGQAEGLLVFGERDVVSRMNIRGSGDALNLRGSVYLADSLIVGDGDTILGVGAAFFKHCEIESAGPFMWIRNTEANHGNVFVDCTFKAIPRRRAPPPGTAGNAAPVLARLPTNHGLNYPYAEAVLINCRLEGVAAAGWGPVDGDTSHMRLWEFNSVDADGRPVDVSERHPASRQLTMAKDAQTIAQYQDPAFVLGGWTPVAR
jgi:pectinesterase